MTHKKRVDAVYNDIAEWTTGISRLKERIRVNADNKAFACQFVRLPNLNPLKLYALLVEFIASRPNGMLTRLIQPGSKPAENIVWWDFLLATPKHLFNVRSGVDGLYADVYETTDGFDPERFLSQNCERHRKRIDARIAKFERHEVYANQYHAFRRTAEWLRDELASLDSSLPAFSGPVYADGDVAKRELDALRDFGPVAMRHHVLAKNLVMNSAFACEALVSTLLRIGALPHLIRERQTLRPLLRANFFQKLEVFHAYTILFERPLDLRAPVVARVRALMEKRNKFVHAEQSEHTRLDDVFFDDDFPLYGGGPQGQVMEFFGRTWLVPSKSEAADALDCANAFRAFIFDSMNPARREEMEFMLDQPQRAHRARSASRDLRERDARAERARASRRAGH